MAAVFCFLAVLLLQAPFASAAWLSASMPCCMGDHCPILGHHNKAATTESEMPMHCGHNTGKTGDCKFSCCKTTDETAINVAQFVLPAPQSMASLASLTPAISRLKQQMLSRSEKPQSPPPRNTLS